MKNILLSILTIILISPVFGQEGFSEETINKLVDRHNMYRQEQGAPNIEWSDELAEEAQNWANLIAKKDQLMHSELEYGENIFVSTYLPTPEEVVDLWADEQKFYNGEAISNQNFSLFGHYTQVIWSSTIHLGCAEAVSKSGNHYWVCEYDPAGNYLDEKPVENYKKPKNK
ncbi:MAG: hypothetical protein JXL97_09600 [Bacteroidales bacterium]|nr:hypothetical protein [Bacteroidales bacterium]